MVKKKKKKIFFFKKKKKRFLFILFLIKSGSVQGGDVVILQLGKKLVSKKGNMTMQSKLKILIADDSKDFINLCSAEFHKYEIEVLSTVKDGQKVVDNILSEEPDVVLMDIFMPQRLSRYLKLFIETNITLRFPHFCLNRKKNVYSWL